VDSVKVRPSTAADGSVPVDIVVTNTSAQIITAYSYALVAHYADGHEQTTKRMVDDISGLVGDRMGRHADSTESIPAGASRTLTVTVPADAGAAPPLSVTANMTMVALADKTALGDPASIASLQASRAGQVKMIAAVVADLRQVKESSSPKKSADDLVRSLTTGNHDNADRSRALVMRGVAKGLESGTGALDDALNAYETYLAVFTEHSKLREVK